MNNKLVGSTFKGLLMRLLEPLQFNANAKKPYNNAEAKRMKKHQFTIGSLALGAMLVLCQTSIHANDIDLLSVQSEKLFGDFQKSCPSIWEDLGSKINETEANAIAQAWSTADPNSTDENVIGIISDKDQFIQQTSAPAPITAASIIHHCTIARTALLSKYYSNLPQNVVVAMQDIDYKVGDIVDGFEVGDIRHTGRSNEAKGWVFLYGQTIGANNSQATLKGEEYKKLFELAKTWAPNTGSEVWGNSGNSGTVQLPDMRGRVVTTSDNLGGQTKGVLNNLSARKIGGAFGAEKTSLSIANMPKHRHELGKNPAHTHTVGPNGAHSHRLRTSAYAGSGAPQTTWQYFEGRARPNYQNLIGKGAVETAANHDHSLTSQPGHTHTVTEKGSGQAFLNSQPSITFNVEMKYK